MNWLPAWVQVSATSATVYANDNGAAGASSPLSRFTFLRVLGGGSARLLVDAYDENARVTLHGWVDPDDVAPSAPATDWRVASTPSTLWRSADASAEPISSLDRFTPLQQISQPVRDRILVRVYRSNFSGVADQGWADLADTGPALPPQTSVPAPPDRLLASVRTSSANQQQAFLDVLAQPARTGAARTGVPASVTVAQAILESDWGRSQLAQNANNYFGMKVMGSLGSDGVVWMPTAEYDDAGQSYETLSAFRAYKSLTDSMTDHDRLLQTTSRYAAAMQATDDPKQFVLLLSQAGYATDPQYADKLVQLMDDFNLYRLDA